MYRMATVFFLLQSSRCIRCKNIFAQVLNHCDYFLRDSDDVSSRHKLYLLGLYKLPRLEVSLSFLLLSEEVFAHFIFPHYFELSFLIKAALFEAFVADEEEVKTLLRDDDLVHLPEKAKDFMLLVLKSVYAKSEDSLIVS